MDFDDVGRRFLLRSNPVYDDEGNEIPDDELPWNNVSLESDPDNDSDDWAYDDADDHDDRPASERRKRVAQSMREEALRRLELSARTTSDFQKVVSWYDREEQSRMRKERRYENLRGDTPLEYEAIEDGAILPISMSQPNFRQICRGDFDDYLASCLFEMHDLSDKEHLSTIIRNLKLEHKEIVYFLGIRLYPTQKLADLRGQTERNIRKVRDVVRRRIHRKLYAALNELTASDYTMTQQEQGFLKNYVSPVKKRSELGDDKSV